jgi:hypothetical protein
MKKIALLLSAAVVVMAMGSCGKTTKGKLEGEWKVSAYSQSTTDVSGGSTSTRTETFTGGDGGTVTITETGQTTQTGVITAPVWTIMKDGTWTNSMITTYTTTSGGATTIVATTTSASGSWDFLKGVNADYKKNERVVFNTLASTSTQTITFNGTLFSTDTNSSTDVEGENSTIYVVKESKKKALDFTIDGGGSWTNGGSTSTETTTGSFTLVQD